MEDIDSPTSSPQAWLAVWTLALGSVLLHSSRGQGLACWNNSNIS